MSEGVSIAPDAVAAIRAEAERAYPHEGCGALLGRPEASILEALPITNRESEAPRTRFHVSPSDYMRVEELADERGLRLLGFWHSHPDHPARPSPTDRRYAWEGLLTLVIAVETGRAAALTAWEVDGDGFRELRLSTETSPKEP